MTEKREEKQRVGQAVTLDFESHLIDEWTFKADGKEYSIKKGGTDVPADKADELIKASRGTEGALKRV